MVDRHAGPRPPDRIFFAGLIAVLCCALAPAASAAPTPWAQEPTAPKPLPIPGAFQVTGTDGYTIDVIAEPARDAGPGSVSLYVLAKGVAAIYRAPATVTETTMQANLGVLGEISVSFHRTNQPASVPCGKRAIRFDSGLYEGKIAFHGEEGYTSAEATSAPGSIDYVLSAYCGGESLEGGVSHGQASRRVPGAELFLRNPGLGARLSLRKRRPGAAALITASTAEYTDGISIRRYASQWMPSSDFVYDSKLRTATITPPAPFAGTARFDREEKAGRRWSGDLTVDLPGRTGVPLTGPTFRAYLVPSE